LVYIGAVAIIERPNVVAMVMKMWEFEHKISYNSACITIMAKKSGTKRCFQGRTI